MGCAVTVGGGGCERFWWSPPLSFPPARRMAAEEVPQKGKLGPGMAGATRQWSPNTYVPALRLDVDLSAKGTYVRTISSTQ